MSEHTKAPWQQRFLLVCDSDGSQVAHCTRWQRTTPLPHEAEANAAFIVRAVNAHDDLVRACKEAALVIAETAKAHGADPMKGTCLPRLLVAIRLAEEG